MDSWLELDWNPWNLLALQVNIHGSHLGQFHRGKIVDLISVNSHYTFVRQNGTDVLSWFQTAADNQLSFTGTASSFLSL